ncbi:prepilin-type N-terminal cleavage/methylation domain-containing protein [Ningiella sp. W23]|uniref:prepilin-type N-terminal cleavage/methylation domain-containing protein n=1 Tax=Ningiella sp. W23 TaxID=3023715 RepID=UPI003756C6B2
MRSLNSEQEGFTLVELIIVIIIIGVLSVTAAPRFIDISSDSKAASLEALKGAIVSSNQIVYGKALIQGLEREESALVVLQSGDTVAVEYGYLAYDGSAPRTGAAQLERAIDFTICHHQASDTDCANADWRFDIDDDHIQFYHISIGENPAADGVEPLCYLQYEMATDESTPPRYTIQNSEC